MRGYVEWLEDQERFQPDGWEPTHEAWIESHLEKVDAARDVEEDEKDNRT
jgi:hypothetical protein